MSLVNCPECGSKVSDQAFFCVHCGLPFIEIKINRPISNVNLDKDKTKVKVPALTFEEWKKKEKVLNDNIKGEDKNIKSENEINQEQNLDKKENKPNPPIQLDVYTVEDLKLKLNIGRKQAYELANSGLFICKRFGRKLLIPKKSFDSWFNSNDQFGEKSYDSTNKSLPTNNLDKEHTDINNIKMEVYTVEDIQKILKIGRRQAYEFVNSGKFPVKKLARKFLIPKKTFNEWFYNQSNE